MSLPKPRWPQLLAAVIAIGFAVGVLVMNVLVVVCVTREVIAEWTWRVVPGTVISSRVVSSHRTGGSGFRRRNPTYRASVSYVYVVGDRQFTGDRVTLTGFGTPIYFSSAEASSAYPEGGAVSVYYNPSGPDQSALRVGVQPDMAFGGFIVLAFNGVLVFVGSAFVRWRRARHDPIRSYLVSDVRDRAVLRLTQFTAFDLAVVVFYVGAFLSVFIVAFVRPRNLMGPTAIGMGLFLVVVSVAAYLWRRARFRDGYLEVVVDRVRGTLLFPRVGERRDGVPLVSITRIEVQKDPDRRMNRMPARRLLVYVSGVAEPREVARWLDASQANMLARWLRREIRLSEEVDPEDE